MVKPITIEQARIVLEKLGEGHYMVYIHLHPKHPKALKLEGEGWYIKKIGDYRPIDVSSVLSEEFIPEYDLGKIHLSTTINGNHIVYSSAFLSIEPPKGSLMPIFRTEGTRQLIIWLQDNVLKLY